MLRDETRVLVRKGLLTNEEVLEEIKAVRREMEGKRWRFFKPSWPMTL